jgi:uncharacterized membrane protein HdeD (DUF308 family)
MSSRSAAATLGTTTGQGNWWLILMEGIVTLIIGLLALTYPATTVIALVQLLGLYWLIAGILRLTSLFQNRKLFWLKLVSGILGILAGIVVLQHPLLSPLVVGAWVIILMGVDGLLIGALELIQALQGRGWGTGILGVVNVLFGFFLLSNPLGLAFALPMLIGLTSVIGGIAAIILAFRVRAKSEA